jgi:hypothetical protein
MSSRATKKKRKELEKLNYGLAYDAFKTLVKLNLISRSYWSLLSFNTNSWGYYKYAYRKPIEDSNKTGSL